MRIRLTVAAAIMMAFTSQSFAQSGVDYGAMADKIFAVMRCVGYAQMAADTPTTAFSQLATDQTSAGRLFRLAMTDGYAYAAAYKGGLVTQPTGLSIALQSSPSADFALGEFFERATEAVWGEVNKAVSSTPPADQMAAIQKYGTHAFGEANCAFLQ